MRNFLVERVKTPYFLLCEEDFVFIPQTDITSMEFAMERCDQFGIIGGRVEEFKTNVQLDYDFYVEKISL